MRRHASPKSSPSPWSASRQNQKTFASHVRDRMRSSHPSPMHRSPAPDLVDRKRKKQNTIRLDRTPAPCGTEPDDRTHSLFTMSKNWLATASQSAGRTSFGDEFLGADDPDQGSVIVPLRHPRSPRARRWSQTGSNRRPHACKARALPTELWPRSEDGRTDSTRQMISSVVRPPTSEIRPWWAWEDSNFRPHAYQARALTN